MPWTSVQQSMSMYKCMYAYDPKIALWTGVLTDASKGGNSR